MPITSVDDYIAARKQVVTYYKSTARSTTAGYHTTTIDLAGNPGAGSLNGSSTTAGVVPVAGDPGFPKIASVGSTRAYLTMADVSANVISRIYWYDLLWKGGAYPFNANVTLSSQPSYASRLVLDPDNQPGTSIYAGTGIWLEGTTTGTGTASITVGYTNESGTAGRSTGAFTLPTTTINAFVCIPLPLQAGDAGVQQINSVVMTGASSGNFNILVMRPLGGGRVSANNGQDVLGFDRTGAPMIFDTTALYVLQAPDTSGTITTQYHLFEVASK